MNEELRRAMMDFIALDEAAAGAPSELDIALMALFGPGGGAVRSAGGQVLGSARRVLPGRLPVRGGTPEQQFVWKNMWNTYPAQSFKPTGMTDEAFAKWLRQGRLPRNPYDSFPVLRQRIGPGSPFRGGSPAWRAWAQKIQDAGGRAIERFNAEAFVSQARHAGSPPPSSGVRPSMRPGDGRSGINRPVGRNDASRPGSNTRPPRLGPPNPPIRGF